MATIRNGTTGNGKIHVSRIRLPSKSTGSKRGASTTVAPPSNSLRSDLASRVRELAHEGRTSQSAIIDCALWYFFQKGQDANVTGLMSQAGIEPGRRRA